MGNRHAGDVLGGNLEVIHAAAPRVQGCPDHRLYIVLGRRSIPVSLFHMSDGPLVPLGSGVANGCILRVSGLGFSTDVGAQAQAGGSHKESTPLWTKG